MTNRERARRAGKKLDTVPYRRKRMSNPDIERVRSGTSRCRIKIRAAESGLADKET